ncbi:MAG: methyltransferase domain-containing protein [Candidatus Kapabacteria bacterium]|jgi:trans-aconitate methyltransferase|nr:methyltransferase domain-containing protein [Candidatus Kapabacteria bacterium]
MQQWNTSLYDKQHSFVFEYGKDVIALLRPQAGGRILDLGCGTAHLTKQIASGGAFVVGLDASHDMIQDAQRLYPELKFVEASAAMFTLQEIDEKEPFDAVFSNATLHWIPDAEGVISSVHAALKSGGRFVAEFGGKGNVALIRKAAREALFEILGQDIPDKFYFPSPAEYATLLERHGFRVEAMWHFDRPTPLEGTDGAANWLRMFGGAVFVGIAPDVREQATVRAQELLCSTVLHSNGSWTADYVRLRLVARKVA